MPPAEALTAMRARGVLLWPDGDRLRYRAPAGVANAKTTAYLRRHKAQLVDLLRAEAAADPDTVRIAHAVVLFDAEPVTSSTGDVSPATPVVAEVVG
ncbi:MAG: hypothetical protein M3Q10_13775 [Chloroflexota bacterium]|nr:hypothetical protein [Chloroflexota bacterium]